MEISRGRGKLRAKIVNGKYELKPEFPEGLQGVQAKNPSVGEYGSFLEQRIEIFQF